MTKNSSVNPLKNPRWWCPKCPARISVIDTTYVASNRKFLCFSQVGTKLNALIGITEAIRIVSIVLGKNPATAGSAIMINGTLRQ